MEVIIKGFRGIILKMDSLVAVEIQGKRVIAYTVTLYIPNKGITIDFENVRPSDIEAVDSAKTRIIQGLLNELEQ